MFGFLRKPRLSEESEKAIIKAIHDAEVGSSAEIRVHLAKPLKGKPILDSAHVTFKKMGMHRTELRNGVLIYVSLDDKQFAIIGDSGIHECVSDAFWNEVKEEMAVHFRNDDAETAICVGIERAGEKLKHYFPAGNINPNELSNEISRG